MSSDLVVKPFCPSSLEDRKSLEESTFSSSKENGRKCITKKKKEKTKK